MVKYCENCGHEMLDDAKFCPDCGAKVVENTAVFCPNCGAEIEGDVNFCDECGSNLNSPNVIKKTNFLDKYKIPVIIIATIVVVAVIIVTAISLTPVEHEVGTQIITVGTNRFAIPGDFRITPSSIDVDFTGYNAVFSQGYSNGEDAIYISVMNIPPMVDGDEVVASQGGVYKSLMGVNGYYVENETYYSFAFVDGAYLNVVSVSSPYLLDEMNYLG